MWAAYRISPHTLLLHQHIQHHSPNLRLSSNTFLQIHGALSIPLRAFTEQHRNLPAMASPVPPTQSRANDVAGPTAPKRRTSSSSSGSLFSGLINQKRNSDDPAAMARRQSFHDQKPATGMLGNWWHNWTQGGSSSSSSSWSYRNYLPILGKKIGFRDKTLSWRL